MVHDLDLLARNYIGARWRSCNNFLGFCNDPCNKGGGIVLTENLRVIVPVFLSVVIGVQSLVSAGQESTTSTSNPDIVASLSELERDGVNCGVLGVEPGEAVVEGGVEVQDWALLVLVSDEGIASVVTGKTDHSKVVRVSSGDLVASPGVLVGASGDSVLDGAVGPAIVSVANGSTLLA